MQVYHKTDAVPSFESLDW